MLAQVEAAILGFDAPERQEGFVGIGQAQLEAVERRLGLVERHLHLAVALAEKIMGGDRCRTFGAGQTGHGLQKRRRQLGQRDFVDAEVADQR